MQENKYRKETKYFCEYCKIFVQNNQISKKNHELSNGHKNALARHLRGVHKKQDISQRESAKNQKMLDIINDKAAKAMGLNIRASTSTGGLKTGSSSTGGGGGGGGKVDPSLYGYQVDPSMASYAPPFTFNPSEFKVTQEFKEANIQTIGVGRAGEWEEYVEPVAAVPLHELEKQFHSNPAHDIPNEATEKILNEKPMAKEFEDEEEGVSKKDVTGFVIKKKQLELGGSDDDDAEIDFKPKRRSKK